jgi:hypothetical protein
MRRWLLFFLAILATTLTAVEARPEIPAFVRPGLVVSYVGTVTSDPDFPTSAKTSSQQITVNDVTSNTVRGTTVLTNYLSCPSPCSQGSGNNVIVGNTTVGWTCVENEGCTPDSNQLGAITQFWSSPTNPILTPENNPYILDSASNPLPCPNGIGACLFYNNTVPPTLGRKTGCVECLIVAVDTTGFVRHFNQLYQPQPTLQGDVGQVTYNSQMTIPWQVDGTSIVLQNDSGPVAVWEMKGTTPSAFGDGIVVSPDWRVVGTGDFYRDQHFDLLFQNANGLISIWEMNGTTPTSAANIAYPGLGWRVAAVGDFNADRYSDILFQHSSGTIAVWTMNGTATPTFGNGYDPGGQGWHAVGTGDFNVPGKSDILWQHDTGLVAIWEMNGTIPIGKWNVTRANGQDYNPGPGWYALGSGHFYGGINRNNCDILFQHSSGLVAIWEVVGHTLTGLGGNLPNNPGPGWHVVGVGDYNGDAMSDILWQHDSGALAVWEMNGITPIAYGNGVYPGAGWHP